MKRNKYIKRVASEADKASQKQKTKLQENKISILNCIANDYISI